MEGLETAWMAFHNTNDTNLRARDVWVADTGASSHMTGDISLLSDFEGFWNPKEILTAGGGIKAMGRGNFLYIYKGRSDVLVEVLYVPGLDVSLYSLNKA